MKSWGKRKLSDDIIREISNRIKEIPRGLRKRTYEETAREFKCSVSTIRRISEGFLTPSVPCKV